MAVNTGRRVEEPGRRTPYNKAPTYQDPVPAPTTAFPAGVPGMVTQEDPNYIPVPSGNVHTTGGPGGGSAPDVGNIPGQYTGETVASIANGLPPPGMEGITGLPNGPGANAQYANLGMTGTGAATPAPSAAPSYDDMLAKYLGEVFGSGRSFAPTEQKIIGQRDDALMQMAEKLASRGMGNSGLTTAGANDIFSTSGQNLASAYQDWRGQGVQEMKGALAPFIEEANAEKLMQLSTEEKKELLNAQLENTMKQLFGNDYDPNMGSADYDLFATMAGKGEPDQEMQSAIERWIKKNPWMSQYFDKDPYDRGGYSPF